MRVLEDESRSRLGRFNQKDVSMVFSSVMRLHPSSPHPLVESCLSSLERHLDRERHPQTLFLLLSYYRLRAQALQGHAASDQQLVNNRKILRLVRHTLGQVSAMREHELALLDEMLALCAQEANNKALEAIFSSQLFYENRQERFIRSMAGVAGDGTARPGGPGCAHGGGRWVLSACWAAWGLLSWPVGCGGCEGPPAAVSWGLAACGGLWQQRWEQEVLCTMATLSLPPKLSLPPRLTSCPRLGAGCFQGFHRRAPALCTFLRFLWVQVVGTFLSLAP